MGIMRCIGGLLMDLDTARHGLRVLLQNEQGLYLQPSGEWSVNRDMARRFQDSRVAYFWALEQKLIGVSVILAFPDTKKDMAIRVVW